MAAQPQGKRKTALYPLITPQERLLIWGKARGIWKHRKPNPLQELKKMRKDWGRASSPRN